MPATACCAPELTDRRGFFAGGGAVATLCARVWCLRPSTSVETCRSKSSASDLVKKRAAPSSKCMIEDSGARAYA